MQKRNPLAMCIIGSCMILEGMGILFSLGRWSPGLYAYVLFSDWIDKFARKKI